MTAFRISLLGMALVLAGTGAPQTQYRRSALPRLEEEGSKDARPPVIGALPESPRRLAFAGAAMSVQVNVNANGNNIVGDAANEPSITVDPTNPSAMSIGWRQFDTIASNFRQAGWAYSVDHGSSWVFPGKLDPGIFRSDPVLGTTAEGKFYYLSLRNSFYDDVFPSTDGGKTWGAARFATGGDKQWMAIDTTDSIGRGHLYQAWSTAGNNYNGRQFSRSTDGGNTWMNPINIPNYPVWGTLDVASNGDLYICGWDDANRYVFARSSNAKNPAVTPTFDLVRTVDLGGPMVWAGYVNPAGLCGQIWMCVDRSNRSTRGNVYMLGSVELGASDPCEVVFARSTDGGNTWSTGRRLNTDPRGQGRYHWFGTLSCAPNGRLDAIWNDTRADATNTFSVLYHTYSLDGGATWAAEEPVSPPFNHFLGYPQQNKMGDYIGMVGDNLGVDIAYAATFNGEEDIYYLRLPAPTLALSGTVALNDWLGDAASVPCTLELRDAGQAAVVSSQPVQMDADGSFSADVSGALPGTYDVSLKASHWLRQKLGSIVVTASGASGLAFSLTNGDVDGDNVVTVFDFNQLSAAFDTAAGDENWNPEADLDGDGVVTVFDYNVLSANFDQVGQ